VVEQAKDLISMPPDPSFADRIWFGGSVMLMGMAIVFSVLILLWAILELFGFVSKKIGKKTNDPLLIPETVPPENTEDEDEEETIAAITAAISVVLEKPASGFRVVSFKKRNNWSNL
jgi:sodium pump decarboxylase gamma subunit